MNEEDEKRIGRQVGKLFIRSIVDIGEIAIESELVEEEKKSPEHRDYDKINKLKIAQVFGEGVRGILDIYEDYERIQAKRRR